MSDTKSVTIERSFAADIDAVWAMWTDPEHFKRWYGPMGATIPTAEFDLEVGGRRFVSMAMETPNGPMEMYFAGAFTTIEPTTYLAYSERMADAEGNLLPPEAMGMPADAPMDTEVQVRLTADGESTAMVMTHVGVPADSPGAQGWTMAIDKLADLLG